LSRNHLRESQQAKKKFTGSKYIFQTRIYNDTFYWLRYVIYDLIGLKNCRKEHGFQL